MMISMIVIGVLNIFIAGLYLGTLAADKVGNREIPTKNWFYSLLPLLMGVYLMISLIGNVSTP
jgi:hypothetical protein